MTSKSKRTPVIKLLRQVKDAYTTEKIKQAKEDYESLIVADQGFHTYPGKVCHTTADRVPIKYMEWFFLICFFKLCTQIFINRLVISLNHIYFASTNFLSANRKFTRTEFGNKQYAFLKILQTNQHITFPV